MKELGLIALAGLIVVVTWKRVFGDTDRRARTDKPTDEAGRKNDKPAATPQAGPQVTRV